MPEPHTSGRLPVGDGHELAWEISGRADGPAVVALHGGPGSGGSRWWHGLADPAVFRTVVFDQRACGRSTPHASVPDADLTHVTTHDLVADVERLREALAIERWTVLGGSWGSTLGLAYAQRHPERVAALVLFSVATTTRREVEWVTRGIGVHFPDAWERFRAGAGDDPDLVGAYSRRLHDRDPAVRDRAARDWCAWEDAHVQEPPSPRFADPAYRLAFARLVTHVWRHAAWLEEGELLAGAPRLAGIPGVLIHGRDDLGSPLAIPAGIARAWPGSELVVVDREGHRPGSGTEAAIVAALRALAPYR